MNQQRIEEFRRKLRQGRPVRVVGGQVIVESDGSSPNQKSHKWSSRTNNKQSGVRVKPHQWGAAAQQPFYASGGGERRALEEQVLMSREYPGFEMDVDDDGTPYVHGWIGPNGTLKGSYHVLVELPPGYGRGAMPLAYILEPRLRRDAPHRYIDGSLCLDHSGAFTAKSTMLTFMAWVSVWLFLYEDWASTGRAW